MLETLYSFSGRPPDRPNKRLCAASATCINNGLSCVLQNWKWATNEKLTMWRSMHTAHTSLIRFGPFFLSVACRIVTWIYVWHKVQKWHLSDYPSKQRFTNALHVQNSEQKQIALRISPRQITRPDLLFSNAVSVVTLSRNWEICTVLQYGVRRNTVIP